jgi:hypothetical protein
MYEGMPPFKRRRKTPKEKGKVCWEISNSS